MNNTLNARITGLTHDQQQRAIRGLVAAGCRMSDGDWTPINGDRDLGVTVRTYRAMAVVAAALDERAYGLRTGPLRRDLDPTRPTPAERHRRRTGIGHLLAV